MNCDKTIKSTEIIFVFAHLDIVISVQALFMPHVMYKRRNWDIILVDLIKEAATNKSNEAYGLFYTSVSK